MSHRDVRAKLARLLEQEPDAEVVVLATMMTYDFDTCYESVCDAYVADIIMPTDVECAGSRLHGEAIGTWGLDPERYYEDHDEALDAVEWFLWDAGCGSALAKADRDAWAKVYAPIARMIVDNMPTHRRIVIETE